MANSQPSQLTRVLLGETDFQIRLTHWDGMAFSDSLVESSCFVDFPL